MLPETVVGVRELKKHLSEFVARVSHGQRVVVTVRGQQVARLIPLPLRERPFADRLRELEKTNLIDAPSPPRRGAVKPKRFPVELAQQYLSEDRSR